MKNTILGSFLALLISGLAMAQSSSNPECKDLFNDGVFQKLDIQSTYFFDDHSQPLLLATGKLSYSWNGKQGVVTTSSHPAKKWFLKEPSLNGITRQTYTSPKTFPFEGALRFNHPTSSNLSCACSFNFVAAAPADPIFCSTYILSREDGEILLKTSAPRKATPPQPRPAAPKATIRNTDIPGKVHK